MAGPSGARLCNFEGEDPVSDSGRDIFKSEAAAWEELVPKEPGTNSEGILEVRSESPSRAEPVAERSLSFVSRPALIRSMTWSLRVEEAVEEALLLRARLKGDAVDVSPPLSAAPD